MSNAKQKTQNSKTRTKADEKAAAEEKARKIAERNAKMSPTLQKYRNEGGVNGTGYEDSVTHTGRRSKICGDDLSHAMAAVEPERAARIAETLLELEAGFLSEKYAKLNPGQIKMNSVNRVRAALKRKDISMNKVKEAIRKIA